MLCNDELFGDVLIDDVCWCVIWWCVLMCYLTMNIDELFVDVY